MNANEPPMKWWDCGTHCQKLLFLRSSERLQRTLNSGVSLPSFFRRVSGWPMWAGFVALAVIWKSMIILKRKHLSPINIQHKNFTPDRSGYPGEAFVGRLCAGVAAYSRAGAEKSIQCLRTNNFFSRFKRTTCGSICLDSYIIKLPPMKLCNN